MNITSRQYDVLHTALRRAFENSRVEDAYHGYDDSKLTWGVNWGCMGTQSAFEARKYAMEMMTAAGIADQLNGLELVVDWDAEETIVTDRSIYAELTDKWSEELSYGSTANIALFIKRNGLNGLPL